MARGRVAHPPVSCVFTIAGSRQQRRTGIQDATAHSTRCTPMRTQPSSRWRRKPRAACSRPVPASIAPSTGAARAGFSRVCVQMRFLVGLAISARFRRSLLRAMFPLRRLSHVACLLILVCMNVAGNATPASKPPLHFSRIDLVDGRSLTNVVVKSFDRASGKLLVIADGKAMTIPIALIPPPFDQALRAAPASGATVSTIHSPSPTPAPTAPLPVSVSPTPAAPARAKQDRSATPSGDTVASRAAAGNFVFPRPQRGSAPGIIHTTPSVLDAEAHKAAALTRARSYYRFEFKIGSDAAAVTGLELDATPPQPIPGWDGRYRIAGAAYLEFYDSRGRSFQRRQSAFEVVTEQKSGAREPVVVEFTQKS